MKIWWLLVACVSFASAANPLREIFAWNELGFDWPNDQIKDDALKSKQYIPGNVLPLAIDIWHDKLFITLPRWKSGVPATLAYIPLYPFNKTASLIPYPSWKANILPAEGEKVNGSRMVSTMRVAVDWCDRLWVMDTGFVKDLEEIKKITGPAIIVFDLKTDQLLRRYELKPAVVKEESYFTNIIVDITPDDCDNAYAYIADTDEFGLVVYSWRENDSWRIKHNYFHIDPLESDYNVGGINFQWGAGVMGLAIGTKHESGYRTLYFHPLSGIREFSVSTEVLQNRSLAADPRSYHLFKVEGVKGQLTQSSDSEFDEISNVLFLTQINRDGIACWNPKRPLNEQSFALIAQDSEALEFPNDFKVDEEGYLWVLSDKLPAFRYNGLNSTVVNFRIMRARIRDLIANTACEA